MKDYRRFSALFDDIVHRSGKGNEELAQLLAKNANYIEQLRDGRRIPENRTALDGMIECFRNNELSITDDEAGELLRYSGLSTTTLNLRKFVEAEIGLSSMDADLTEKIDDPKIGTELRKQFENLRDQVRKTHESIPIKWDPEILEIVAVPLATLDQLNRIDEMENILFAAIGVFGGAGFSMLAENLSSDAVKNGEWVLFFILVLVTSFLTGFLILVRKNKTAIKQPYHSVKKSENRS